mmetsp:Transcript_74985/g.145100  ORF Transcript_74985/g.145100 Transcript_74985/m.145100 type:complete len:127 (-) Transcript_74985:403-783(-)
MALFRRAGASLTSIFSSEGSFFNSELLVDDDYAFSRAFSDFDDLPVVTRTYRSPADMSASNQEAYQMCIKRIGFPPGDKPRGAGAQRAACDAFRAAKDWHQLAEDRAASTARYVHSYERWTRAGSK